MGELQARARVAWGGYRGEIRGASGALEAPTSMQAELGGPGDGTNPEELFAAAHANCFTSTLTSLARAHGVPLARIETTATVRLGWSDGHGDHALVSSALDIHIDSPAPWEQVERLVKEAERECPVCRAIAGNVVMTVALAAIG